MRRLTVIQPQIANLEKASTKICHHQETHRNQDHSLDVMSELYDLVPDNIYLRSVTIDEKGAVNIKGTSSAMSEVFSFVTSLENSKYFKGASASNTSSRKEGNKTFRILK